MAWADDMNEHEFVEALDSLVAKGFLEKQSDGTYRPTELGRLVAKESGGEN